MCVHVADRIHPPYFSVSPNRYADMRYTGQKPQEPSNWLTHRKKGPKPLGLDKARLPEGVVAPTHGVGFLVSADDVI